METAAPERSTAESWPRAVTIPLGLALAILAAASAWLSFHRIFQVDELESVLIARILATHRTADFSAAAALMLLGPMTWIAGAIDSAAEMLRTERFLFLLVFWANLILIVRCAGLRLRSAKGMLALLLAGTLAPLWDYGFEIRHDNLLLTALLLAWLAARPLDPARRTSLFAVGLWSVLAQFIAFKAFVYTVPIIALAIFHAIIEEKRPIIRSLAMLVSGAAIAFGAGASIHWLAGTWTFFSSDTKSLSHVAAAPVVRFSPAVTLSRLEIEAPLLAIAAIAAAVVAFAHARLRALAARDSLLPESAFLFAGVVTLFVNPTPFPYNLVLVVPQAAILTLRLATTGRFTFPTRNIALAFLAVHLLYWGAATRRHFYMSNARQVELMTTAEELTTPAQRVLDGTGLVPTRFPPGHDWLIHTFTIEGFRSGASKTIRAQLAEGNTPVIIPNYRTNWLPVADHTYIRNHYFAMAGDFYVAGTQIDRPETRTWDCPVAGRYFIASRKGGGIVIDGTSHNEGVVTLKKGPHELTLERTPRAFLIWVGPTLPVPPPLGPGEREFVFVNWY